MKKLLAVILVLAFGSAASAGLSWSISGSTVPGGDATFTVNPGDAIVMTLTLTDGGSTDLSIGYFSDGDDDGEMTDCWLTPGYSGINIPGYPDDLIRPFGFIWPYDKGDWIYIVGAIGGTTPISGDLLKLWYTVPDPFDGEVTIQALRGEFGTGDFVTVDGWQVAVPDIFLIPEPMTIVLLGLGGLILRKRR